MLWLFMSLSFGYKLLPFCTDGCSVVGNKTSTSYVCCVHHDLAYWAGGSREDKYRADGRFYQCLLKTEGKKVAETYAGAVALYGDPYWGTDWLGRPRFKKLTKEEKAILEEETPLNPYVVFCGEDPSRRAIAVPVGPKD